VEPAYAHLEGPVHVGEAVWYETSRQLSVRGEGLKLPWRVTECFALLVEARGGIVSRQTLEEHIWGKAIIDESSLAKCVAALRKALDPAPHGGSYIETVSRTGYRLTVPVAAEGATVEPIPPVVARPDVPARRRWAYLLGIGAVAVIIGAGFLFSKRIESRREAERLTAEALVLVRRSNPADGAKAVTLFQQAVDLRPDLALPYAGLAEASARYGKYTFESASVLARKSLELDPNCSECQAIWGYILMTREWRWNEAGKLLQRSVSGGAPDPQYRIWYAMWLAVHGRFAEALRQTDAAIAAKPTFAPAFTTRAMVHLLAGNYEQTLGDSERAISLHADSQPGYYWMGRAHAMLGQDVNVVIDRAYEMAAWGSWRTETRNEFSARYEALLAERGRRALAHAWIEEVGSGAPREVNRYNRAMWFAWAGEYEAVLEELEAAIASRPYWLMLAPVDPAFVPLRNNPRFRAVLSKLRKD